MREQDVPQDPSFYRDIRRACYAVGRDGKYVVAASRGFDDERVVTEQALLELEREVEEVRQRVANGELSPLAYHLATHQMTPRLFAQHVGIATWRVRRHLRPATFARLKSDLLQRYAACLDVSVDFLRTVEPAPRRVFFEEDDA